MDLHLLGPIEARLGDRTVALGARKQRAVLAMLGLEANRTVSSRPAGGGAVGRGAAVQRSEDGAALRLAAAPAAGRQRRGDRHARPRLRAPASRPTTVDVARFERLVRASRAPREALALWRGEALADVADEPFAAAEIRRLDELRVHAHELAIEADLDAGAMPT